MISVLNDMMKLDAAKFAFQFFEFSVVGIHLFTSIGQVLVNLVDDQGGVNKNHKAFHVELHGDAEALETCFIFGSLVRDRKMNPKYISELILGGSNEQYTCPGTFDVKSPIKIHLPMLGAIGQDRLLDLSPFGDEISQNL